MSGDLTQALLLFAGSGAIVIFSGVYLAKYGDALAGLMGWGRLWVGTILVAVATSLPELAIDITAVMRNQPELALGDALGSNMVNMLILAVVALIFGAASFFRRMAPQQKYLVLTAISLTGLALLLGSLSMSISLGAVGLASLLILGLYVAGMRLVYFTLPKPSGRVEADPSGTGPTMRRAWIMFGLASLGVLVAAPSLAFSVESISETTGLSTSFLGVVALALVTSFPEASTTFAAVRLGAVNLAVGTLLGSCAFNVLILALVDPFYRQGVLVDTLEGAHLAAGLAAILLMSLVLGQVLLRGSHRYVPVRPTLVAMGLVYTGGVYLVYALSS